MKRASALTMATLLVLFAIAVPAQAQTTSAGDDAEQRRLAAPAGGGAAEDAQAGPRQGG